MKHREINHHRDLNHYPHSARYQIICGIAFIVSSVITIVLASFALNISYRFLIIYAIWMLFTILCPEIRYFIYASKDKIYYLKKQTYDGDLLGSICDGILGSIIMQLTCSNEIIRNLLKYGIIINPYLFLICTFISLIPFGFICFNITSIKTKIWCFFKYVFFYNLIICEIAYFVIGTIVIFKKLN